MHPRACITAIIPVFNEETRITDCLESLFSQNTNGLSLEVLIIDDDSTDKTLEICRRYPVTIIRNGTHDWDIGKALGINAAKGDFLLFIDADNRLSHSRWLLNATEVLIENPDVAGVQSWKFRYDPTHSAPIRYHALWGGADPFVFYLGRCDHIPYTDNTWRGHGTIIHDAPDHIIINFHPSELPTVGSQGFLTRRGYFKETMLSFHHTEAFIHLTEANPSLNFCFLKNDVIHIPYKDLNALLQHYVNYMRSYCREASRYKIKRYPLTILRLAAILLVMQTLVVPLWQCIKGYFRLRDFAWFYHVFLCIAVPWIYFISYLRFNKAAKDCPKD